MLYLSMLDGGINPVPRRMLTATVPDTVSGEMSDNI